MKKLAFTTAVALALATAAYAQDHHGGGGGRGPGPGMGGGGGSPGLSAQAPSGGSSSNFSAPRGPTGPTTGMGPNRGASTLYNRAPTNMNSDKSGGRNFDRDRNRLSDRDNGRHLYNRADRDHDFGRDRNSRRQPRHPQSWHRPWQLLRTRAPLPFPPLLSRRMGIPDRLG